MLRAAILESSNKKSEVGSIERCHGIRYEKNRKVRRALEHYLCMWI